MMRDIAIPARVAALLGARLRDAEASAAAVQLVFDTIAAQHDLPDGVRLVSVGQESVTIAEPDEVTSDG